MSNRASAWAWDQDVKSGPKFVLVALADRADEDGECFPSVNWICKKTQFSKTAVKTNIARLFKENMLEVTTRRRVDGSHTSNLYRLCIPEYFTFKNTGSDSDPSPPDSDRPRSKSDRLRSESDHHKTLNYTPTQKNKNKPASGPVVDFINWYATQYTAALKQPLLVRWKRDIGLMTPVLELFDLELAKVIALKLLTSTDKWLMSTGRDIQALSSQWNKLATEGVDGASGPSSETW